MAATTTTAAEVIRPIVREGYTEAVYRNSSLVPIFLAAQGGAPRPSGGDTSRRWKVNSAGNTSVETYSEGGVAPASGEQTWVSAAVAYTHFRIMVEITGHLRAALQSDQGYVNALAEEFALGQRDIVDLINTTYMSGTNGMETAVDSTTAYAGITRGSASYFESAETAVSGALAVTDLEDLVETMLDNDRGASAEYMRWFMPYNQATNIYRLTGTPAQQMISDSDKAPAFLRQTFGGIPMSPLGDFTNTVIILADLAPGMWEVVEHEGFMVHDQGRNADADLSMVTYRGGLVCLDPKLQGKLTGVTA
jgi:hypothetical protein